MLCVIAWAIMTTLIAYKIINLHQPFVQKVLHVLTQLCDPPTRKIRKWVQKILPNLKHIDLAPLILLLLLNFAYNAIYHYFYNL
jgi:YggT family protein